jgi:hypothetical protein
MSLNIKNLYHDEREVGKTFKRYFSLTISSKKYYVWEFVLNNKLHKVEFFHSKVSGKKRVVLDSDMLIEKTEFSNDFSYSFPLDKSYCNIVQLGLDKMEFRIDNKSFSNLIEESMLGI